jgi:hypothetical protein
MTWYSPLSIGPALIVSLVAASPAAAKETSEKPAAAAAEPAAEPAADPAADPAGYFRFDYDSYGLQLWVGATHRIGGVEIYSDVYVTDSFGEVDVGPQLRLGDLTLVLTAGPIYDFSTQSVVAIVAPFLTTVYDHPRLYFESWLQWTFASPFAEGEEDLFHTRNFLLYKLNESLWAGPQVELNYGMTQADDVVSLPVGGQLSVGYGKDNRLSLFLGYETREQIDSDTGAPMDSDRLAGRVTFIRLW